MKKGMKIHDEIVIRGLLEENDDVVLDNALVDTYAEFGEFCNVESLLQDLSVRTGVSWSAPRHMMFSKGFRFEMLSRGMLSSQAMHIKANALKRLIVSNKCKMRVFLQILSPLLTS